MSEEVVETTEEVVETEITETEGTVEESQPEVSDAGEAASREAVAKMSEEDLEKILSGVDPTSEASAAGDGAAADKTAAATEAKPAAPAAATPTVPTNPGGEPIAQPTVADLQAENRKLKDQHAAAQRFIAQQAAEIGMARKGNPEEFIARRKAIAEKFISGNVDDVAEAQAEQRQLERDEESHGIAVEQEEQSRKVVQVIGFIPNLMNLVPEMEAVLIEEDKVNPTMAKASVARLGGLGPVSTIYSLAKRAEQRIELKQLREAVVKKDLEIAELKKAKVNIVDGINRAARQSAPLKAGGGNGSPAGKVTKPVTEMTDAELEAVIEGKA